MRANGGIEMNLEDVIKFLSENKDNDEVKSYLSELKTVSKEDVEGYLDTEEGKKLLQPRLDKYFTKGLETWKEKNLDKLVDDKVKELYPEETPEQKKLRELELKLEKAEKEKARESLKNKAISLLTEKELPTKLVDKLLGEDEDSTIENITLYEEVVNDVRSKVKTVKGKDPHVDHDKKDAPKITRDELNKMSYKERVEFKQNNPELYDKIIKE